MTAVVQVLDVVQEYPGVRALKGVGDYTAAAICSIVYKIAVPVIDGNVCRLLSRWGGVKEAVDSTLGKRAIGKLASSLIDEAEPGLYNEGAMELGEVVCLPQNPHCSLCPLARDCVALREALTDRLPVKLHKTVVKERFFTYLYVTQGGYTFVKRRNQEDIWKNLYEFPLLESGAKLTADQVKTRALPLLGSDTSTAPFSIAPVCEGIKHQLTHRTLHADFYRVELPPFFPMPVDLMRVPVKELSRYAFPRLIVRFIEKYIEMIG